MLYRKLGIAILEKCRKRIKETAGDKWQFMPQVNYDLAVLSRSFGLQQAKVGFDSRNGRTD